MNIFDRYKQRFHKEEIETVEYLDLYLFLGTWYEIARIGHWYDEHLLNAAINFTMNRKGKLNVMVAGNKDKFDGHYKIYEGKA